MIALSHKRATVNGVTLHYVTVGKGPVVLCMHGWPQNHREFLPVIEGFADQYTWPCSPPKALRSSASICRTGLHGARPRRARNRRRHHPSALPRARWSQLCGGGGARTAWNTGTPSVVRAS
jgi:hypothetical protein